MEAVDVNLDVVAHTNRMRAVPETSEVTVCGSNSHALATLIVSALVDLGRFAAKVDVRIGPVVRVDQPRFEQAAHQNLFSAGTSLGSVPTYLKRGVVNVDMPRVTSSMKPSSSPGQPMSGRTFVLP